jgi:hypothetical protein
VIDSFSIIIPEKKLINEVQNLSALQSAPSKDAKITGFQFRFSNPFLTKVFGEDFSRPPAGKIYFK